MTTLSRSVEVLKLILAAFWANEQQAANKNTNNAITFLDMVLKVCSSTFLELQTRSGKIYYLVGSNSKCKNRKT
jgi:hypothetical protein